VALVLEFYLMLESSAANPIIIGFNRVPLRHTMLEINAVLERPSNHAPAIDHHTERPPWIDQSRQHVFHELYLAIVAAQSAVPQLLPLRHAQSSDVRTTRERHLLGMRDGSLVL